MSSDSVPLRTQGSVHPYLVYWLFLFPFHLAFCLLTHRSILLITIQSQLNELSVTNSKSTRGHVQWNRSLQSPGNHELGRLLALRYFVPVNNYNLSSAKQLQPSLQTNSVWSRSTLVWNSPRERRQRPEQKGHKQPSTWLRGIPKACSGPYNWRLENSMNPCATALPSCSAADRDWWKGLIKQVESVHAKEATFSTSSIFLKCLMEIK